MENPSPVVLEISSDEEAGCEDTIKASVDDVFCDIDYDFLSKMLGDIDDDDDDDVVFVSEVVPKPPKRSRIESLKAADKVVDDDDCVVLDGDPDKAVVVENEKVDNDDDDGNDSDDLEIVGEKGEIACRDFPHARHLCVKFVFASTPHEAHCSQCHCYVCDSLAPCSHWGSGNSIVDHCHASDKEEYWRSKRKTMQKGDKTAQIIPSMSDTFSIESILQNPPICPPQRNSLPQNQGLRPAISLPVVNQSKTHQSAQLFALRTMFKRPKTIGASPKTMRPRGSRLSRYPNPRYYSRQAPVMNPAHGSNQRNFGAHSVLPSQIVERMDYPVPSRPEIHSNPNSSCLIREPIHGQSQTPSRPFVNASFVNQQPHEVFQPYGPVLSHNFAPSYHSDAGNVFGNQLHSRSTISSHPNMSNHSSQLISGQNSIEQGNHAQNGVDSSPKDSGFAWDSSHSHGNLPIDAEVSQSQSIAHTDNFHFQCVKNDDHSQSIASVDNVHQQSVVPADNSCVIYDKDYQIPENTKPDSSEIQFGSWIFENQTLPGTFESPGSPDWNLFSPEPASIDTDLFPY